MGLCCWFYHQCLALGGGALGILALVECYWSGSDDACGLWLEPLTAIDQRSSGFGLESFVLSAGGIYPELDPGLWHAAVVDRAAVLRIATVRDALIGRG